MTNLRSTSDKPFVKSGLRFGWLALATLLLTFVWMTNPTKHFFASATSKNNPSAPRVTASPTHKLTASYYSLKGNLKATLMLSNQGPNVMPVQIALFSKQGIRNNLPATSLAPNEVRAFDLRQVAPPDAEEGNLQVEYQGRPLELGGVVMMADAAQSLIFDEELTEPARGFASARLEGVWWRPTGSTEIQVALTNTTDAPLSVKLETGSGDSGNLSFQLKPHATRVLNTEANGDGEKLKLNGVTGGLSIKHSGAPGALIAHGFIQEASKGFSNVIEFSDPQKGILTRLDGAGLRVEAIAGQELTQVVVLRNVGTTEFVVKGRLPYTLSDGTQETADLPAQKLAPGEVKKLELSSIIARLSRSAVVAAGLEFTYAGEPGSLIAAALSMSKDRNQVFRVLMRDAQVQASSTGTYPWSIDGPASTVVYLKNVTDSPKQFTMSVRFAGGYYSLDEKTIPAGQTMTFDVRSLRDQQKPDSNGKVIPLDVANGQVHWSAQGRAIKAIIGRAEQIDTEKGLSMTSACGICCQDSFVSAWMTPGTVVGLIGDTTQFSVYRENRDCYGNHYSGQLYPSNWSCDNTSVATVTYTGLATGVGVGNSLIRNPFDTFIYNDEGSYCLETPVTAEPNASCLVKPSITSLEPDRGLIGTTINVTINGTGFGAGATIQIAGGGITVSSVAVNSSTKITANFAVAANATSGGHAVTVTYNAQTSNNNKTFYVQIPTKIVRFDLDTKAPNGYGPLVTINDGDVKDLDNNVLLTHQCGVYRSLAYDLVDQEGEPIVQAYQIVEKFSDYMGVDSLPSNKTRNIAANGLLQDTQYFGRSSPSCLGANDNESFNQKFDVIIGQATYALSTVVHISKGRFNGVYKADITTTTP